MTQKIATVKKQRLTAFIDPILVKRAKVRGALEGLTISEIVHKALDAYAPKLTAIDSLIADTGLEIKRTPPKHSKRLVVTR